MDLYIDRDELARALAHVKNGAPREGRVLLTARPEALRLATTDTELAIRSQITANVQLEGELSVDVSEVTDQPRPEDPGRVDSIGGSKPGATRPGCPCRLPA